MLNTVINAANIIDILDKNKYRILRQLFILLSTPIQCVNLTIRGGVSILYISGREDVCIGIRYNDKVRINHDLYASNHTGIAIRCDAHFTVQDTNV